MSYCSQYFCCVWLTGSFRLLQIRHIHTLRFVYLNEEKIFYLKGSISHSQRLFLLMDVCTLKSSCLLIYSNQCSSTFRTHTRHSLLHMFEIITDIWCNNVQYIQVFVKMIIWESILFAIVWILNVNKTSKILAFI